MADEQKWESFRFTEVLSHNNAAITDIGSDDGNHLARNRTQNYPSDGECNSILQPLFLYDEDIDPTSPVFSRNKSKQDNSPDFFEERREDSPKECHLWGLEQVLSCHADHSSYLKYTATSGEESYTTYTSSVESERKEEHCSSCTLTKLDEACVDKAWEYSSNIVADEISQERTEESSSLDYDHDTEQHQCSYDWIEKQGIAIRSLEAMSYRMHEVVEEIIGKNSYSVIPTSSDLSSIKLEGSCEQETNEESREDNEQCNLNHGLMDDDDIDKNVSQLIEEQEEAIHSSEMIASIMSQALDEFHVSTFDSEAYNPGSSRYDAWVTYWSDDYQREYFYNIESKQVCWFLPRTEKKYDADTTADSAFYNSSCREIFLKDPLPFTSYYFSHSFYIFLALIITLLFESLAFLFATEFTRNVCHDQELIDSRSPSSEDNTKNQKIKSSSAYCVSGEVT